MQAQIELPKAFSVREENEFFAFQHLMARLNSKLMVEQAATGKHINGGCTSFWGIVYLDGHKPGKTEVEAALKEAGFDFCHNAVTGGAYVWNAQAGDKQTA
jgi:hypothetical protein